MKEELCVLKCVSYHRGNQWFALMRCDGVSYGDSVHTAAVHSGV